MARRKNPIYYKLKRALALIVSKKPITQKLLMFKKTKKYKLFKYYNYSYIGEYQFSPSNTPLMYHHNLSSKKKKSHILSLLCGCATLDFDEFEEANLPLSKDTEEKDIVEFLPMNEEIEEKEVVEELEEREEVNKGEIGEGRGEEDDDESVDGRAQRFIERFYEEIRLERQDSAVQWMEMLQRSC